MKKLYKFFVIMFVLSCFSSCTKDYDDTMIREEIKDLTNRVLALEQWCDTANEQFLSLKAIVGVLQERDFVTNVEALSDNSGYTIYFDKANPITILHGEKGDSGSNGKDGENGKDGLNGSSPQISIKKDTDENYYWVLNGNWLLDEDGNKVRVTGENGKNGVDGINGENGTPGQDGYTPQISIEAGADGILYWKIDGEWLMCDGLKVPASVKQEQAIVENLVIDKEKGILSLTLIDGNETISLPILTNSRMHFDMSENGYIYNEETELNFTVVLPSNLKKEEYEGVLVEVFNNGRETPCFSFILKENNSGSLGEIAQVKIKHPDFEEQAGFVTSNLIVSLTDFYREEYNGTCVIKISIIGSTRNDLSASRTFTYKFGGFTDRNMPKDKLIYSYNGEVYECELGQLSIALDEIVDIKHMKLGGKITTEDILALQKFKSTLESVEICAKEDYIIPENAFKDFDKLSDVHVSYNSSGIIVTIEKNAFENCISLTSLDYWSPLKINEEAFKGCSSLCSINLSDASIGTNAFENCVNLETVTLIRSEFSDNIFKDCINLNSLTIGEGCTFTSNAFDGFDASNCNLYYVADEYSELREEEKWNGLVWKYITEY